MASILLIDDDAGGRQMASYNLRRAGHEVAEAAGGVEGLAAFDPERHDVVITDVRMPGLSGIEVARKLRADGGDTAVVVMTAYGDVQTAVEAMKAGAEEFVLKPFNRDQLLLVVERVLERRGLARENRELHRRLRGVERPIVYAAGSAMAATVQMADRVARSDAAVLVTGESGTGKELVARRIHARGPRGDGPFVALNCAAIPPDLMEAELFGHEKGAFTGAERVRLGRFRQADGGTLFLDEVLELPIAMQGKLLRVLEEGVVDVVGSDEPVHVDVRIIAATNRNAQAEIAEGRFRQDLYFRLCVVEVTVPPLRERAEDIPALVSHFVLELAADRAPTVPDDLLDRMKRRPWPGNVRELRNACERLVVLCPGDELSAASLPPDLAGEQPIDAWPELPPDGLSLVDLEKRVIERVLALKGGNISEAARYLRVPRHILVYRINKHGIERPRRK